MAEETAPVRPSLRRRLLLHLTVPLLLVLALGAAGGMAIARHIGDMVHDRWLLDSAMTLAAQARVADGRVQLSLPPVAIEMFAWDRMDRIYWQATTTGGTRLLGNAMLPPAPRPLSADEPQYYDGTYGGKPVRVVALLQVLPGSRDGLLRIEVAETLHKRDRMTAKLLVQWAPLQIAVLLLAGAFIWIAVTRNLRKVDAVAEQLRDYDVERLAPVAGTERVPVEIAPLIGAMNRLILKLRAQQASQKRFISNAAHQLRTPLATLQVQTQRLMRERDPMRHDEALGDVHQAVGRLHHVTEQLLVLMRSEQDTGQPLTLAPVDLAALARAEVERWTDRALGKDIDLGYEGPACPDGGDGDAGAVMVAGEAHLLRELLANLIDNAIRYNRRGGVVTLSLSTTAAQSVTLVVDDDGPGIPAAERSLVLERFYRGSTGAGSEGAAGGCGLGLPIAREIAARHGATLTIEGREGAPGTRVRVVFAGAAA